MNADSRVGAFSEKDGGCMYWMWKRQISTRTNTTSTTTKAPSSVPASRRR